MAAVIECRGLTKRYRGTTALAGLDLTVEAGQVFGFLGANGAGKTTTMRILLGLVAPSSGRAWLNGKQVPDPAGLARVGTMIEEPAFYPWLTGRRNLDLLALSGAGMPGPGRGDCRRAGPGRPDRGRRPQGQGVLAGDAAASRPGGRAAAPAVAAAARRAANGMDPAGIKAFRTLLRSLTDDGTTVFLSSHLLAEVGQVCDQVAVIHAGRLVEQGPVGQLASARPRLRLVIDPADQPSALALLRRWRPAPTAPARSWSKRRRAGRSTKCSAGAGYGPARSCRSAPGWKRRSCS